MYFSLLHGQTTSSSGVSIGAPTECRHGTKSPSSPITSSAPAPMRVIIRMCATTYAESVSWTPTCAIGEPSGPIEYGTTYIVRPFIDPRKSSVSFSRISFGSHQLLVGPASSSRSEQMNVRSSAARAVVGVGAREERVGPCLLAQLLEDARLDHFLAEAVVLLLG